MALSNFGELKTAIADELNRTDLSSKIPDWVTIFESVFPTDIQHRRMQTSESLTLTSGVETVALPTDFIEAQSVILESSPRATLAVSAIQDLISAYPDATTGEPKGYAIVGANMHFRPLPDSAYSVTLYYYQRLTALSDDSDSNWLLTYHPEIYLYGSLVQSATYLGEDSRLQSWLGLYDRGIARLKGDDARSRYSGAPVRTSVDVNII